VSATIHIGDALTVLRTLPAESVHCCVTSPPYWGLRDYGVDGQIGLEETPQQFVAAMVAVFEEVRRVLREDGVCWVNLGDSYATSPAGNKTFKHGAIFDGRDMSGHQDGSKRSKVVDGLKPKDLVGIPWRVAFALQDAGWWLRSDCIWGKPNPMPESVQDRPTKAHEYVFLLTKSARYFYDAAAVRQTYAESTLREFAEGYDGTATKDYEANGVQNASAIKKRIVDKQRGHGRRHAGFNDRWGAMPKDAQQQTGSNLRSVWWMSPQPFRGAHFATMPEALAERCIMAGCPKDGTVLDPFTGSGTTGVVAVKLGRSFVGCELNPTYAAMARKRITGEAPLFVQARIGGT